MRRRSKHGLNVQHVATAVVAAPIALAALGWLYQRVGLRRDARRHTPPGLLLFRAGRYLHVLRQGAGTPTVIFEAGLAATSLSWARVQPLVAAAAKTASYDRAGLGWSSPLTRPPTLDQMVEDLRAVLAWVGNGAPAVLVAHSFGALLVMVLAHRHPERVAGLVLVDPMSLARWASCSAEDQRRIRMGIRLSLRGARLANFGLVRVALAVLLGGGGAFSRTVGRRAAGRAMATLERLTREVSKLPASLWPTIAAQWSRAQSFRAMADMLTVLTACAARGSEVAVPRNIPVAVLSAGTATPEELLEREGWIAALECSQHMIIPESGHWLHLDHPEQVADAVDWCLKQRLQADGER